ncbi:MAG: UDP-glucose 4-epimerase GalE [Acidobacteria bacterium]|nr:UDP-glucose 4-epimerase GalE [Acidobacteriota bacterium]
MDVLVTGGAGYIGSFIVQLLRSRGDRAIVLDDLSEGHTRAVGRTDLVVGDIVDPEAVDRALSLGEVRAVIHMAASAQVGQSMRDPAAYYENNLVKSIAFLNLVRARGVAKLVFSSTAAVYGEPVSVPITEEHPTAPTNPYGATKLAFEHALRWYGEAYGFRSIALRYFNASGGGLPAGSMGEDHDPETHLVPNILRAALGVCDFVEIFGTDYPTADGTCLRDYVHVLDLAEAHVLALRALDAPSAGAAFRAYNLGADQAASVRDVIRVAEEVSGRSIRVLEAGRRPGDPALLLASSARLKKELGWSPRFSDLKTIIDSALAWHRDHPRGYGD